MAFGPGSMNDRKLGEARVTKVVRTPGWQSALYTCRRFDVKKIGIKKFKNIRRVGNECEPIAFSPDLVTSYKFPKIQEAPRFLCNSRLHTPAEALPLPDLIDIMPADLKEIIKNKIKTKHTDQPQRSKTIRADILEPRVNVHEETRPEQKPNRRCR